MKIKLFKILLLVLFFALFIWYVKNDGIYVVTHLFSSELDMINEYAIYDVEFSEKTIVERYEMENDYLNIPFISHSKAIKATLLVPNEEMESIVPKFAREYDLEHSLDIRTEKKVSGGDLNCGRSTKNKNLNTENLRKYRGVKISKGQRRIRKQKYFYQPNDLVKYDGKVYTVKGTQNEGKYIALKEIKKVPKVELLIPYVFKKGLNWSYGLC